MKTDLFEITDVTASIYDVSEHARGSLGITQGHFVCFLSFVKVRAGEFECSCVFVWTAIFLKTLLVWTRIYFYTDKQDAFSKIWYRSLWYRSESCLMCHVRRLSSVVLLFFHGSKSHFESNGALMEPTYRLMTFKQL